MNGIIAKLLADATAPLLTNLGALSLAIAAGVVDATAQHN